MNRVDYDDFSYDDDDEEEDLEEIKESRKKRIQNKKRDKRREHDEIRLKPMRQRKPRAKFHYDPDFDEDDYEDYQYYG